MNKEEALLKALQNWDDALACNDLPEMERYMAPDWVIVGTGGGITARADFLASVISGHLVQSPLPQHLRKPLRRLLDAEHKS